MRHVTPTDDVLETASLYALGALLDDERSAFERHLAEGCAVCEQEVASMTAVVGELALDAPPRELRERMLERISNPEMVVRAGSSDVARPSRASWRGRLGS